MAGLSPGLIAGLAALGVAGGSLVWVTRKKAVAATLSHAPTVLPPAGAMPTGVAKPILGSALYALLAARKRAFQALTPTERSMVVASEYLASELGACVAEMDLPWTHYKGTEARKMRAAEYELFAGRFFPRLALLLNPAAKVVQLQITNYRWQPWDPLHRMDVDDIQAPPFHLPVDYPAKLRGAVLTAAAEQPNPPAGFCALLLAERVKEIRRRRTGQPWNPSLDTAPMPPAWIIDAGKELRGLMGDDYGAGQAIQGAVTDALAGAAKVLSARPVTLAQLEQSRDQIIHTIVQWLGVLDFWQSYRYW